LFDLEIQVISQISVYSRSQEVALNKLEKGSLRYNETAFCSPVALMVLEKNFKVLAFFQVFHFLLGKGGHPKAHSCKKSPS
jgi:hypothetical protein